MTGPSRTTSAAGALRIAISLRLGTWDYDCDGTIETSKQNGMCDPESVYPDHCINVAENYPESDCGMSESTEGCTAFGENGGEALFTRHRTRERWVVGSPQ